MSARATSRFARQFSRNAERVAAGRRRRREQRDDLVRERVLLPLRRFDVRLRPRSVGLDSGEDHRPLALRRELARMDEPRGRGRVVAAHRPLEGVGRLRRERAAMHAPGEVASRPRRGRPVVADEIGRAGRRGLGPEP